MRTLPEPLRELAEQLPVTMNKQDAALLMSVSTRTIDRAISEGKLRVMKTSDTKGGRVVITRAELLRFMAERMQ